MESTTPYEIRDARGGVRIIHVSEEPEKGGTKLIAESEDFPGRMKELFIRTNAISRNTTILKKSLAQTLGDSLPFFS